MINEKELRSGNIILHKTGHAIKKVACNLFHFELMIKEGTKDMYPVLLKPDVLESCGFIENKDYPLAPGAREFILTMPVMGNAHNQILGYTKTNGECFARAAVNGLVISNNIFHLHNLQNLYFALTGAELAIKI